MKKITLLLVIAFSFSVGVLNAATTYYSIGSVDVTVLTNWKTGMDGTGTSPLYFNTAGDIFIIQNGHSMTTSAAWAVGATSGNGKLQIQNGGKLTATFDITTKVGNTFQIDAGGTYEHNVASNLSLLFTGTESFDTNSNFVIIKCLATPSTPDNGYGNLTMKNAISANLGMNGRITSVKGNFSIEITATNSAKLALVFNQTTTLNVGGNLTVNSPDGTGVIQLVNSTGSSTINVAGNVDIQKGTLSLFSGAVGGVAALNITGNLSINSTGILNSPTSASPSTISFLGSNSEFSNSGTFGNTTNINLNVASGSNLTLASNYTLGTGRTLTVDGTINIGTSDTLRIGGATSGAGVINTTVGTIVYNGTSAQTISNIKDNTVNNLVVNNATGLTLSSDITVTGNLNSLAGTITLGNYNLTVTNTGSVTNIVDKIIQNGTGVFTNNSPTTVISKSVDNLRFKTMGESIEVSGLERGSKLMLYAINGQSVINRICREDSEVLTVKRGIYIAKIISSRQSYELKIIVE